MIGWHDGNLFKKKSSSNENFLDTRNMLTLKTNIHFLDWTELFPYFELNWLSHMSLDSILHPLKNAICFFNLQCNLLRILRSTIGLPQKLLWRKRSRLCFNIIIYFSKHQWILTWCSWISVIFFAISTENASQYYLSLLCLLKKSKIFQQSIKNMKKTVGVR